MKTLPKKRVASGALIFNEKEEFIIVEPSYKSDWEIPGGGIEKNESPQEALIREIKEELGVDLDALGIPTMEQAIARYSQKTAFGELTDIAWYLAYNLFRIAAIRTLKEADQQNVHLKTAAKYAFTTQDRAVVVVLTLETQPDISSEQIIDFLDLPQTVLNVELPQMEQLREMLFRPTVNNVKLIPDISLKTSARVTRPLRHQLLQILQQHLSDTAASDFPSWTSSLQNGRTK